MPKKSRVGNYGRGLNEDADKTYDITPQQRNQDFLNMPGRPEVMTTVEDNGDHIYLNLVLNNPTSQPVNAVYQEDRLQPLLDDPSKYYMTIARAFVPMNGVPIFFFSNNSYSVSLTYTDPSGFQFTSNQVFLIYTPSSITDLNPDQGIGSFQHMIDIINTALASAFTLLSTAVTTGLSNLPVGMTQAPYMIYDAHSLLCSLVAQKAYAGANGNSAVKIYFNRVLYSFFYNMRVFTNPEPTVLIHTTIGSTNITSGFLFNSQMNGGEITSSSIPLDSTVTFINASNMTLSSPATATSIEVASIDNGLGTQIIVENTNNNACFSNGQLNTDSSGNAYYIMNQEYVALYNWLDLNAVVFIANDIPIRGEYLPAVGGSNSIQNNPSTLASRQIITDIVPNLNTGVDLFSNLNYLPSGPYRLLDLVSTSPLKRLDLQIYFEDAVQNLIPLQIPPSRFASVKLLFIRKDAINKFKFF